MTNNGQDDFEKKRAMAFRISTGLGWTVRIFGYI